MTVIYRHGAKPIWELLASRAHPHEDSDIVAVGLRETRRYCWDRWTLEWVLADDSASHMLTALWTRKIEAGCKGLVGKLLKWQKMRRQ
jgi:hypothetical protein